MIDDTLNEREKTHGSYPEVALIAQSIKAITRDRLSDCTQRESLDLIATKIARILCGDAENPDHWHDIAGYARLVERELNGRS